jgi:hypothetical protein
VFLGKSEGQKVLRHLFGIGVLLACAAQSQAVTIIPVSGNFTFDDDIATFVYTVQNQGQVDIYTTSFATGGFATIISVFDAAGNLVNSNDGASTNDCGFHGMDPILGACYDALTSWVSDGGVQYTVVLTQYDNSSVDGATLASGFRQQGNGNFTGMPPFNPAIGGAFWLPGPFQRTSDWTIVFESADASGLVVVPEPATGLLLFAGGALVAWKKTRKPL